MRALVVTCVLLRAGLHQGFQDRTRRLEGKGKNQVRMCGCGHPLPPSGICAHCSGSGKQKQKRRK